MNDWKTLDKGERLPKHNVKVHNYQDGKYSAYYLLDDNENVIAEYKQPRHKGVARLLRETCNMCDEGVTEYPVKDGMCTWCGRTVEQETIK